MLFRRRTPLTLVERVRYTVWPEGGWRRALRYFVKRILRLNGSPHAVALGFGVGIFVAWSPFFGLHWVISAGLAFALGGNVLAAVLSTTLGNPLTYPAMIALAYPVGAIILGDPIGMPHELLAALFAAPSWAEFFGGLWSLGRPYVVGSIPVGLVTGVISYFIVRFAVTAYQEARRQRLAQRRLENAAGA